MTPNGSFRLSKINSLTALTLARTREVRDYTKIEAWRYSDDLTVAAYEITRRFPREEIYGLTSQLRRASYSEVQRQVKATISRSFPHSRSFIPVDPQPESSKSEYRNSKQIRMFKMERMFKTPMAPALPVPFRTFPGDFSLARVTVHRGSIFFTRR